MMATISQRPGYEGITNAKVHRTSSRDVFEFVLHTILKPEIVDQVHGEEVSAVLTLVPLRRWHGDAAKRLRPLLLDMECHGVRKVFSRRVPVSLRGARCGPSPHARGNP
jgi:hypothetical protein